MRTATTDDFLNRPPNVEIAHTARVEWAAYEGQYTSKAAALQVVLSDHIRHVREMIPQGLDAESGAVLITDIPDTDLALIDVHFPSVGERFVSIFPRKGAELVVDMLSRQMPKQGGE